MKMYNGKKCWKYRVMSFAKYPLAVVVFNLLFYSWFKYTINDANLELSFKEKIPSFF